MSKRNKYQNLHLDENRRRQGALERLQAQLKRLQKNDIEALFLKYDEEAGPEHFKKKIEYVKDQIKTLEARIPKTSLSDR